MGQVLGREAIESANDVVIKRIEVPEWGGDVFVRSLTGSERDSYEASMSIQKGDQLLPNPIGARARLVVRGLCDESGERLYKDTESGALSDRNGAVLDRLWDAIAELSGMTNKAVKDAEGDSDGGTSDGSTSD